MVNSFCFPFPSVWRYFLSLAFLSHRHSTSDTFLSLAKPDQLQRWASFDSNVCKIRLGEMSKCVEVFNLFVLQGCDHSIFDLIFNQKCKEVDVAAVGGH